MASKTRFAMSATASHRMMFGICIASIALLVDRSYHLQTTGYVTVLGFSATGAFIGSTTAEWLSERYPRRSITVMAFALAGIAIFSAAMYEHPRLGLIAIALCALAFQNLRIRSDATIQANSSKANIGRLFAAYDVLYNIAFVVGCMTGILASAYFSYGQVLGTVALGYASCALIFLKLNDGKRQDDNLTHPSARLRFDDRLVGV
jgi:MFS family permease